MSLLGIHAEKNGPHPLGLMCCLPLIRCIDIYNRGSNAPPGVMLIQENDYDNDPS